MTTSTIQGSLENSDIRCNAKKYLTREEISQLLKNVSHKLPQKNRLICKTLFLITYRHGLRISESLHLRWSDVNFVTKEIFIRRLKGGVDGTHNLRTDELSYLKKLRNHTKSDVYVFQHNNGRIPTVRTVQYWFKVCSPCSTKNIHSLRHSCAVHLLSGDGITKLDVSGVQRYLGHKSIVNTGHYLTYVPVDASNVLI